MFSKFSLEIHNLIYESFPETYFVGGAVRNLLLGKKVSDYDISTAATPSQIVKLFKKKGVSYSDDHANLGVITARKHTQKIEITTFRKELYSQSRFPKVSFVTNAKTDSNRRDFTINALYFNPVTKEILDFHNGLKDLQKQSLKFIGNSLKKIKEDPLRIVRAYRFQLQYKLKIDAVTQRTLNKNKSLLKTISKARIEKEINAVKHNSLQKILQKVIHSNA
ncbi:MAG TPA: hypothetical protein VFM99_03635 [Chitinophagales bacterium]|nr:hypothetical protein [Chitinophagales bacterium]